MVVLDTNALIFWTIDPLQLSASATNAISNTELLVVSSISIWEVGLKTKQGKLTLPLSLRLYVENLGQTHRVQITSVTEETWLTNLELAWAHKDPADRTIVATATLLRCPLISSDRLIQSFYPSTIW
jgi:PIN domain nuclease of toxin-antitoxin system